MQTKFNIWSLLIPIIFLTNAIAFGFKNSYIKFDFLFSILLFIFIFIRFELTINLKILIFILFLINGLITSFVHKINTGGVFFNFLLILFFGTLLWNIFKYLSFEILLKSYIKAAKVCVYFGIIQIVSFIISIRFPSIFLNNIYDPRSLFVSSPVTYAGIFPKISSFFTEPSYLSCFLLPYLIICYKNIKKDSYSYLYLFLVSLVFIFTFSIIGFISLFCYFLSSFLLFNKSRLGSNLFFLGLITIFIISNESMYIRIIQIGQSDLDSVNLTTLGYLVNMNYIKDSLNWRYLFGYGLDSYQIIIGQVHDRLQNSSQILLFNKSQLMLNGAPNLFFRVFVEYGFIGYILILKNFRVKFLTSPFFFGFLAYSFRSGEYLRFDTLFFLFMFLFFNYKDIKLIKI